MPMHRRRLLAAVATLAATTPAFATGPGIEIWRQRSCGCCTAWARQLERAGYHAIVHDLDDVTAVRRAAGVPDELAGCHTARIDGYVVEGHVPVAVIERLLRERPAVTGIAVPGMPIGSPGMEMPGLAAEPYDVVAFGGGGRPTIFARIG